MAVQGRLDFKTRHSMNISKLLEALAGLHLWLATSPQVLHHGWPLALMQVSRAEGDGRQCVMDRLSPGDARTLPAGQAADKGWQSLAGALPRRSLPAGQQVACQPIFLAPVAYLSWLHSLFNTPASCLLLSPTASPLVPPPRGMQPSKL